MTAVFNFRSKPRTGPLDADPRDVLVPALEALRKCCTAFDVAVLVEMSLPDGLLPELTWHASRKPQIYPRDVVGALVKVCGVDMLRSYLGRSRGDALLMRYGKAAAS